MWFERNVIYCVCIYDLSVLAVSRMGFQKKNMWVGGLSSIQICFGFLEFFYFAKPLTMPLLLDRVGCRRNMFFQAFLLYYKTDVIFFVFSLFQV